MFGMSFTQKFAKWKENKNIKYGLPFLLLMVVGSIGLQQFTNLKYKFSKQRFLDPEELESLGITMKKPGEVTLESEYEKIKELDIENWQNIRGPRPWEEDTN